MKIRLLSALIGVLGFSLGLALSPLTARASGLDSIETCESRLSLESRPFSEQAISLYREFYRLNWGSKPTRLPLHPLIRESLAWMRAQLKEVEQRMIEVRAGVPSTGRGSLVLSRIDSQLSEMEQAEKEIGYRDYLNVVARVVRILETRYRLEQTLSGPPSIGAWDLDKSLIDILGARDFIYSLVRDMTDYQNGYAFLFIPTERELSLRDFNEISGYPIFPLGLAAQGGVADGFSLAPASFWGHDQAHSALIIANYFVGRNSPGATSQSVILARGFRTLSKSADLFGGKRVRFNQFLRNEIDSVTEPKLQAALEIVQFFYIHERGLPLFPDQFLSELAGKPGTDVSAQLVREIQKRLEPMDLGAAWPYPKEEAPAYLMQAVERLIELTRKYSDQKAPGPNEAAS